MSKNSKDAKRREKPAESHSLTSSAPDTSLDVKNRSGVEADFRTAGGPMRALSDLASSFHILETRYVANLYTMLSYTYDVACYLRDSEVAWDDFIADPVWNGIKGRPMEEDRSAALRPVLKVAVGLRDDKASKLSSKYWAALAQPFRKNVSVDDLSSFILQHGGIEKLVQAERQRRKGPKNAATRETHVPRRFGGIELVESTPLPNARMVVRFMLHGVTTTVIAERNVSER